ncbi:MAG: sulfatase-like hydrolase/transferase [Verrucomicrobiaceae bacterium]|nr:sulfatase-like hydrolase/transferase [Verrucomicrobiaceae bacterium]
MKLLVFLAISPFVILQSSFAAERPNVLLIISDDQGFGDFGFNGNKLVRTPNLDRLASKSAVYRNFIVAAACSPTRSSVFTGRDHLLTGVWGVPPRANLRDDETRMPAFFKAAGYHTMHVGKLDCAKVAKQSPDAFGWDDWMGGGGYEHKDPMVFQRGNNRREQGWTADIWTNYALDYMKQHRDEPWFASVAFIIPHMPWVCDEKYSAPFLAQGCSKDLAACYGSIAHLDECIGRLLDGLKETGQAERTIIAFLSDNGPTSPEAKHDDELGNVPGEDWQKRNVAHLRGHKALVWENGDRVPLLVRWPGHIAPGDRQQLGGAEDVLPTLLDLSGVKDDVVKHQPFTGISLKPSLDDAASTTERTELFRMAIAGKGSPRELSDIAMRKFEDHHLTLRGPRFKYHALPGGAGALFDVAADPGETDDVQTKFPDVTAQMAKRCRDRWDAIIGSGRSFMPLPPGEKAKAEQ